VGADVVEDVVEEGLEGLEPQARRAARGSRRAKRRLRRMGEAAGRMESACMEIAPECG
jgi:hypothetical protein